MKKFISILISVVMVACLLVPTAFAIDTQSLASKLDGIDVSSLSKSDISSILGVPADQLDSVLGDLQSKTGGSSEVIKLGTSTDSSASSGGSILDTITGLFGNIDMSSFDVSSIMDTISGVFGDNGLDLGSLTSGMDMGDFDISSILGGLTGGSGDSASGATDTIASIADGLMSALGGLGLDTSSLTGLLDSDIVDTIANLFIGLGDSAGSLLGGSDAKKDDSTKADDKKSDSSSTDSTKATEPAKTVPSSPKTGDNDTLYIALAVLALGVFSAFVCIVSKKRVTE